MDILNKNEVVKAANNHRKVKEAFFASVDRYESLSPAGFTDLPVHPPEVEEIQRHKKPQVLTRFKYSAMTTALQGLWTTRERTRGT